MKDLNKGIAPTVGEMRKMAEEGKLTSAVILPAMEKGLASVQEQFAKMPPTVERATSSVKNNLSQAIAEFDKATGSSTALANSIISFGNSIKTATPTVVELVKWLPLIGSTVALVGLSKLAGALASTAGGIATNIAATRAKAVADAQAATAAEAVALAELNKARSLAAGGLATNSVVVATANYTAAQTAAAAAAGRLGVASTMATTAMSGMRTVMAMMGGPIGVVIAGVAALIYYWEDLADAIGMATSAHAKYAKTAAAMNIGNTGEDISKEIGKQASHLQDLQKEQQKLQNQVGQTAARFGNKKDPAIQNRLKENQAAIADTQQSINKLRSLAKDRNKLVAEQVKAELWAKDQQDLTAKNYKPVSSGDDKAAKAAERKAKAAAEEARQLDRKDDSILATIASYKQEIAILQGLAPAQAYVNEHTTKAAKLNEQLTSAKSDAERASIRQRIALENEAASLLRSKDSLEEYKKVSEGLVSSTDEYIQKMRESSYEMDLQDKKYSDLLYNLKQEAELLAEIKRIKDNTKLTKEDQAKAVETAKEQFGRRASEVGKPPKEFSSAQTDSEVDRIEQDRLAKAQEYYNEQLRLLQEAGLSQLNAHAAFEAQKTEISRQANQARLSIAQESVANAGSIADSLLSITKDMAGEQSRVYTAMFAVSKAFAIADSIIKIQQAMASASASLPFPANLGAMATVAAQTASIVSNISAVTMQASGGKFAKGAAFSAGSVVDTPTNFPMSGGKMGLMGEAGPEAIMPLTRTSSGDLGVRVEGAGNKGGDIQITNSLVIQGNADQNTIKDAEAMMKKVAQQQIFEAKRSKLIN